MMRRPPTPDRRMDRRNSNADQPIDLTHMDAVAPPTLPNRQHSQTQLPPMGVTASATEDSDSYVPESLADFVAEANGRLEALQMDFMNSIKQDESMNNHSHSVLLSPDPTSAYYKSPPPPDFHGMTDSQIKASIFGDSNDNYYRYDEDHGYIQEDELFSSNANTTAIDSQVQRSPPPQLPSLYSEDNNGHLEPSPSSPPPKLPPPPNYNSHATWKRMQPQPQPPIVERDELPPPPDYFRSLEQDSARPSSDEAVSRREGPDMPPETFSPREEQLLLSLTSPLQSNDSDFRTYSKEEWNHPPYHHVVVEEPQEPEKREQLFPPHNNDGGPYTASNITAATLISYQHYGHNDLGNRLIQPCHHPRPIVDVNVQDEYEDNNLMTAFSSPTATDAAEVQDDDITDGITELPSVTTTDVVTDGAAIVDNDNDEDDEDIDEEHPPEHGCGNEMVAVPHKQQPVSEPLLLPVDSEEDGMQDSVMTPSPLSMGSPKAAATSSISSRVFPKQEQTRQQPPSLSPTPLSPASTSARSAKLHALITAATEQQVEVEVIPPKEEVATKEHHTILQTDQSKEKKNGNNSKTENRKSQTRSSTGRMKTKASPGNTPSTIRSKATNRSASVEREKSRTNKPKMQTPERQKKQQQTPSSASSSSPPLLLKAQKNRSTIKLFTSETAHRLSRSKEAAASAKKSSPYTPSPANLARKRNETSKPQTESSRKQKDQSGSRIFSAESADRLHKATLEGSKDRARSRSASPIARSAIATPSEPLSQRSESATRPRESAPSSLPNVLTTEMRSHAVHATSTATLDPMERLLRPTEAWVHHAQRDKPSSSTPKTKQHRAPTSSSSIERLLRPTEAWTHAHEKKSKEDDEVQSREEVIIPPPSKKISLKTVERLCKPTVSSAAMASPASARRIPGLPHTIFMEKKFMPTSLALDDSMDNEERVFPSNISHPPSPIAPSSHLLMPTVTSATKKREKRKSIVPFPRSTKKVSGVSGRLLSATAASRARTLAASETNSTLNSQTRAIGSRPQSRNQDSIATTETENRSPQKEGADKTCSRDRQSRLADEHKERRVLTIPKSPKLATIARHGKPPTAERKADVSLALSNEVFGKGLRDDSTSVGSHTSRGSLTIPTEPKLATSMRYGTRDRHSMLHIRNPATEVSLAQSTEVMMRELRGAYHPPAVARKREGLTIPKAPKFSATKKRDLPKSTAEKEEEEMEYFKAHAFKANPIPISSNQPCISNNRRATMPAKLTQSQPQQSQTPEDDDIGRKASKSTRRLSRYLQPTASHAAKVKTVTRKVSTTNQKSVTEPRRKKVNIGENGLPVFKARPPPITTYHPDTPPSTASSKSPSSTTPSRPFTLATSSRPHSRDAVREASRQRIEEMAQQREAQAAHRRLVEEQTMKQRYAEQRKTEEAQRRQQLHKLQPHVIPKHQQPTTTHPFHLTSAQRHEIAMCELNQRLEAEEEERRRQATSFRAKPVPKTTYVPKKISPRSSEEPLTDPFSPELQSKGRAVSRKEYDEFTERQRQIAEAQLREIEARRRAEEEAEIQELRRLPVKEGGLIPTAEPINAVFWKG